MNSKKDQEKISPVQDIITLADLTKEFESVGRKQFRINHNNPFLLLLRGKIEVVNAIDLRTLEDRSGTLFSGLGAKQEFGNVYAPIVRRFRHSMDNKITIGRAPENDIVIQSKWISKIHAAFDISAGGYWIQDMGSRNGSKFNDQALIKDNKPIKVTNGDIIKLWDYSFEFSDINSVIDAVMKRLESNKESNK